MTVSAPATKTATAKALDPFDQWCERFVTGLEVVKSPASYFSVPPVANGDPKARLARLTRLRDLFRVNDSDRSPHKEAAKQMAAKLGNGWFREDTEAQFVDILQALDSQIVQCLDLLPPAERHGQWVRTADFKDVRHVAWQRWQADGEFAGKWVPMSEVSPLVGSSAYVLMAVGALSSLPPDHPLRSALPAEDFYLIDRTDAYPAVAGLVLGRLEPLLTGGGQAPTAVHLAGRPRPHHHLADRPAGRRPRREAPPGGGREEQGKGLLEQQGRHRGAGAAGYRAAAQGGEAAAHPEGTADHPTLVLGAVNVPKTQNQKDAEGFLGRLTGKGGSGGQTEKAVVRKTAKTPVNAKDRSERSVVTEAGLGKGPQPGKGPKKSAA